MTISSVGDMENKVFSYTVGGAIIITNFGEKNLAMFIKIKVHLLTDSQECIWLK